MTLSCQECKQQLLDDPAQPFYDRQRHSYLPPLCYGCGNYEPPTEGVVKYKTVYLENLTDGQFLKLQAEVRNVQEKVEKLTLDKNIRYIYNTIGITDEKPVS